MAGRFYPARSLQPVTLSFSLWERGRQKFRRGPFEGSFSLWEKDRVTG